jgi:PAS domain S-box-containing protein
MLKRKILESTGDYFTSFRTWVKIGDMMNTEVVTISPEDQVTDGAKRMSERNISCIVVTEEEKVLGILTEKDFLKCITHRQNFESIKVRDVMSHPVISAALETSVLEASDTAESNGIKQLPVIDGDKLVGIVTQTDMIRVLMFYGMCREVSDIMSKDVASVGTSTTVAKAAKVMAEKNISCIGVTEGKEVVGVITERDLLQRIVAKKKNYAGLQVVDIMSSPVKSVSQDHSIFSANRMMEKLGVRRLVVLDQKGLCGIVTQTDIFRSVKHKLQKEEEECLKLLEKANNGVFNTDLDGKITYVNPALLKLLEVRSPEELIGKEFLPDRFWAKEKDKVKFLKQLREGNVEINELALQTWKGRRIYVTIFSTFTKDIHGTIDGNQALVYDITEQKELVKLRETEERLNIAKEEAEQFNRELEVTVWFQRSVGRGRSV